MSKWWHHWRKKGHIPKNRVESFLSIDSSRLYDQRQLHPFKEGEEAWILGHYFQLFSSHAIAFFKDEGEKRPYTIPIVATKCNYGKERHWFLCPRPKCARRCKKLYFYGQNFFLCRKCCNLAYFTQNRGPIHRTIDKKWALIEKLGGEDTFSLRKPKCMHQKTFDRLEAEIWRLDDLADQQIFNTFGPFFL